MGEYTEKLHLYKPVLAENVSLADHFNANCDELESKLGNCKDLTASIITQLVNMGEVEISVSQWAWLGGYGINAKARAYQNAPDQTIANSTATKIRLDVESYDPGDNFDAITNYRFVAPVSGFYQVNAAILWNVNGQVDHRVELSIQKNGTTVFETDAHRAHNTILSSVVSDIVWLDESDYLEIWGYQNSGANCDVDGDMRHTYLSVHFLSPA